ncbi:MAG: protein-glutamate O-methyltransferase CheR [Magnetococcales bacterium]|nr:protein-glutamate O-methyltransferase CheR [Magnetococcales bacterium]
MNEQEIEALEIRFLLEVLHLRHGYDFRNYSKDSIRRRLRRRLKLDGLDSISQLQHHVLHDVDVAENVLRDLSITVTEMFRDPAFYLAIRKTVLPQLTRYPHFKVWHAGCATGEEAYSMAIMLAEAALLDRCHIYATDFNNVALNRAKEGIISLTQMRINSANYQAAGGTGSLSDYVHANYDGAVMDRALKRTMVFAHHNLATDTLFGEMQMIVCRNVLIYFDTDLQEKVLTLFAESLSDGGFLCLGSHETLMLSRLAKRFEPVVADQRIYQKVA